MNASSGPSAKLERLLEFWGERDPKLTRYLTLFLAAIAIIWVGYETWRLLFQHTPPGNVALMGPVGAVDLSLRHLEVNGWFSGEPIYETQGNAVYPPASHLLLWPFVGWLSFEAARWLWAVVVVVTLVPLLRIFAGSCGEVSSKHRLLLLLIPLATYPVGATIGNGQISILVLSCMTIALPLLQTRDASWKRDTLVAALFLVALVKPTLAAPFFLLVLSLRGGLRPAALIIAGYAALTALAALSQKAGPISLMRAWYGRGVHGSGWGAEHGEGSIRAIKTADGEEILRIASINLHSWLGYVGLGKYIAEASFGVLGVLALWLLWRRKSSIWLLLGVVAVVTRFYTYHGWYDDVVLLLSLMALLRIASGQEGLSARVRFAAGVLSAAMVLSLLAPGGGYLLPYPWSNVYLIVQSLLWLGILGFLVWVAGHSNEPPSELVVNAT